MLSALYIYFLYLDVSIQFDDYSNRPNRQEQYVIDELREYVTSPTSNFRVSFTSGKDELVILYDDEEEKEDDSDDEEENNTARKPSIFGRYDNPMENIKEEQTDIVYDDEKKDNDAVVSKGDIELQPMQSEPVIVEEIEKELSGGITKRLVSMTGLKAKETQRNSGEQQMNSGDRTIMDDHSDDIDEKVENEHIYTFFRIPMISLFDICIFVCAQDQIVEEVVLTELKQILQETEKEDTFGNKDRDQTQSEMEPQIEAEDEKVNSAVDGVTVELDVENQVAETKGTEEMALMDSPKLLDKDTASKKKKTSSKKKKSSKTKAVSQRKSSSKKAAAPKKIATKPKSVNKDTASKKKKISSKKKSGSKKKKSSQQQSVSNNKSLSHKTASPKKVATKGTADTKDKSSSQKQTSSKMTASKKKAVSKKKMASKKRTASKKKVESKKKSKE